MADQLKQFMIGLEFQIDNAGMAKIEAFAKSSENYARQMAQSVDKLTKSIEASNKQVSQHAESHHKMREAWRLGKEAAIGFTAALGALAITGEEMVRRVSKQFEQLYYLSQRTGVAGHSIEQLRFQFKSIGLDAAQADQAVSSLAAQFADFPSMRATVESMIGRPFKDAGDAVTGLIDKYAELLETGSPQAVASLRDRMRFAGMDPEVYAQGARQQKEFREAAKDHHKILHDLGIEGEKSAKELEKRSVAFRREWIKTQETLGKVVDTFAGALMPGITRFLGAVLGAGGIGDVNESFEELCKRFDAWVQSIVGADGEKVKRWFVEIRDVLTTLKDIFLWLEEHIGLFGTLLLAAFAPSIVKGLVSGLTSSIISGFTGLGAAAGGAFGGAFTAVVGPLLASAFAVWTLIKEGTGRKGSWTAEDSPNRFLDPSMPFGMEGGVPGWSAPPASQTPSESSTRKPGFATGGIVPINAHAGEAVLPASLTRMLLNAANQPQAFAAQGRGGLADILDNMVNDFNQWWSGSAAFSPIVQLAQDYYDKMSAMLHQLLEDFGFVRTTTTSVGSGSTSDAAPSAGGGGGGMPGRSGGGRVRPDGGGGGDGTSSVEGAGAAVADKAAKVIPALMKDLNLTKPQASALFGNLAYETGGFTALQEKNPTSGRGGYGWAQWTGPRRVAFEQFAREKGLDPKSDEANYQFLVKELRTTHAKNLTQLKGATTLEEANRAVHRGFEASGDTLGPNPTYRSEAGRLKYGQQGMAASEGAAAPGAAGDGGVPESGGGRVKELQGRMAAIRKLPLQARLKAQLEYAAEQAQVVAEVFSGGQEAHGPHRTGSHRHDKGGAGDVQLRDPKTGQLLDMRKPEDQARMAQFVTASVAAGVTGVGSAEGYMGAHGIHLGGGQAGTWGASQRFGSAPQWLQNAYKKGLEMRGNIGDRNMQRNLGTDKPAWRQSSLGSDGGDYGGGGDKTPRADKLDITVTTTGAAHGTGKTSYDMASRESPIKQRNAKTSFA